MRREDSTDRHGSGVRRAVVALKLRRGANVGQDEGV
jgi:hypothetical protein